MKSFERIIDMVSWWLDMTNEQVLIFINKHYQLSFLH